MGLADFTADGPDNFADPTTAGQRAATVSFVAVIEHEGQPDGTLFHCGSTNNGIGVGFDAAAETLQFFIRTAGPATTHTLITLDDLSPIVLSAGIHTYAWCFERTEADENISSIWIDGRLYAVDPSTGDADWSDTGDLWYLGEDPASPLNGFTHTGVLTNARFHKPFEVVFGHPLNGVL
jgi:hypothetical protein